MNRMFSIFGSCVSRDAFGVGGNSKRVAGYTARCAIASAVSGPVLNPGELPEIEGASLSPFEQRMVARDIGKDWYDAIRETESDSLVIDLIDDRFSLIELGGGYLTESASLTKTKFYEQLQQRGCKVHGFFNREEIDRAALPLFAEQVSSLNKRLYIHRAMWALKVSAEDGVSQFERADYYKRMNEGLAWRYDALATLLPEAHVIDVPDRLRVADPHHRWGVAPFHYVEEYYEFVRNAMGIG